MAGRFDERGSCIYTIEVTPGLTVVRVYSFRPVSKLFMSQEIHNRLYDNSTRYMCQKMRTTERDEMGGQSSDMKTLCKCI